MNEIAKTENQVPAIAGDPYAAYGATVGTDTPFLKFVKGQFKFGADDEVLPLGTRLVPHMSELKAGYILWKDGTPEDEAMVRIAEGKPIPQREDGATAPEQYCRGQIHGSVAGRLRDRPEQWPADHHPDIEQGREDRHRRAAVGFPRPPYHQTEEDREHIAVADAAEQPGGSDVAIASGTGECREPDHQRSQRRVEHTLGPHAIW